MAEEGCTRQERSRVADRNEHVAKSVVTTPTSKLRSALEGKIRNKSERHNAGNGIFAVEDSLGVEVAKRVSEISIVQAAAQDIGQTHSVWLAWGR